MAFDIEILPQVVDDVYTQIRSDFISPDDTVNEILGTIFERQGKGIRPVFMLMVAELLGGEWNDVREFAVIIEAIHIASLIHDDLIDGSPLRRGASTLNVRYSNKTSVLYGDYIFVNALRRSTSLPASQAVPVIHDAVNRMVVGEIRDSLEKRVMDEDSYLAMIANKTGALFAAAGELAAVAVQGTEIARERAAELGHAVGMAFQLIDDLLDFDGDAAVMGKPRYMDILSDQFTLPVIHVFGGSTFEDIQQLIVADKDAFVRTVKDRGGLDYASDAAKQYVDRARGIVETLNTGTGRDMFEWFFTTLTDRVQ